MKLLGNIGSKLSIALFIVFTFSSCSTEQKLAKQAGNFIDKASLLVLFPDNIFVINSKAYKFPDSLTDNQRYLASIDSSFFLKNINADSLFKEYKNAILNLYSSYGFMVYQKENINEFLSSENTGFIIEFTQLQLEEYFKPFEDEEEMNDGYKYTKYFILNALGIDAWITVSELNDTKGVKKMIYSEASISDEIDGLFNMELFSGEVKYNYNLTPLKVKDAYDIIDVASIKISLDIIDFIVNSYIESYMLFYTYDYPERFWRYNPKRTRLTPVNTKSGYIIME